MYKFRDTSFDEVDSHHRTTLQVEFSPILSGMLQSATILFLYLTLFFEHKFSLNLKLFGTEFMILGCFIAAAIFILIDTDE